MKKHTSAQLNNKVLYFAYGSNMHQPRLESRVGAVECLGKHILPHYKLTFDTGNGFESFANVKQVKDETCEGVIYEMTYYQLLKLDWYEGLYKRVKEMYNDRKLHIYISEHARNEKKIPAIMRDYKRVIEKGCIEHNLNKSLKIVQEIAVIKHLEYLEWLEKYENWY